jgi:hypothetical protein
MKGEFVEILLSSGLNLRASDDFLLLNHNWYNVRGNLGATSSDHDQQRYTWELCYAHAGLICCFHVYAAPRSGDA